MPNKRFVVRYHGEHVSISSIVRDSGPHLVVFLHGFGCAKEYFEGVLASPALDHMSHLALDFPGHGESGKLGDVSRYTLQTLADITNAVIDQLAAEHVSFVAHSMGGAVALIASQARHDVNGIVDADGNLTAQDCGITSRHTADQTLSQFVRHGYQEFLHRLQASTEPDARRWAISYASSDPAALHQLARSLVEWSDSGKLLGLLTSQKRALYLYGDRDSRDYLLHDLRGVAIRAITNSGHFMMLDNPAEFAGAIGDFFSDLVSCGSAPSCYPA